MGLIGTRSTMSIYTRKKTQYQKFLNIINVFLIITSTILVFTAGILMRFYHVDKLDFWSAVFYITPTLMMALGVYTFLACIYGFLISGLDSRIHLTLFSILIGVSFFGQLASIFTALELRNHLVQDNLEQSAIIEDLSLYGVEQSITDKWDTMQTKLHCCGGKNFLTGYNDYRNTPIGANNAVPDSCCHVQIENCGKNIFKKTIAEVRSTIFIDGCVQIVKDQLDMDVMPMMIGYASVGVLMAIAEIIAVVLSCAYIAQIRRRLKRDQQYWRSANQPNAGADEPLQSSDHETVC